MKPYIYIYIYIHNMFGIFLNEAMYLHLYLYPQCMKPCIYIYICIIFKVHSSIEPHIHIYIYSHMPLRYNSAICLYLYPCYFKV